MGEGVIIISADLSPADTAQMKIEKVQGFATDIGGKTSHTAIVARSIEIPAVVGLENITRRVRTNDLLIIDGSAGWSLLIRIRRSLDGMKSKRDIMKKRERCLERRRSSCRHQGQPSRRNRRNIEFIERFLCHQPWCRWDRAYRTEFIYINREQLPTEEDHFSIYKRVVETEKLNWSTIRTFDLGGDKFLSDPKLAKEMNPQMGLRAIRFCLKEVDLFKVQLRAIIRASAYGKTRILFP